MARTLIEAGAKVWMPIKNSIAIVSLAGILTLFVHGQSTKPGLPNCGQKLALSEFLLPQDANAAMDGFRLFRNALLDGDRKKVADRVKYPLEVVLSGSAVELKGPRELLDRYDDVFTPFVVSSVRKQSPEHLVAGWYGVSLEIDAVRFVRDNDGYFVGDVIPVPLKSTGDVEEFLSSRITCPPIVIEGDVVAYNWVSRIPAFENIYVDHLIVDVRRVLSGVLAQTRIRVDFWGVSHLPAYNLPREIFSAPQTLRLYLRPAGQPPENREVCDGDVQESVPFVDENGQQVETESAVVPLEGESASGMTYVGLLCFEAKKQYVIQVADNLY